MAGSNPEHKPPPGAKERFLLRSGVVNPQITDGDLVVRGRDGDAWAVEALFRRHIGPLTAMITRLVGREPDADDIVQDAFAEALDQLHHLRHPEAFRSWLYRIAIHRAHKLFRRQRLVALLGFSRFSELDEEPDGFRRQRCVVALAADQEITAELHSVQKVLRWVRPEARLAWTLRYVQGEKLTTVADLLDCSLATAKRRIAIAQAALEGHLRGKK